MEITLGKNGKFKLTSDDRQFILQESYEGKGVNDGKVMWKDIGYYKDLTHVLLRLTKEKLLRSESTTLKELLQEVSTLGAVITKVGSRLRSKWGCK